jgi:hypothetical protein
MPDEVLLTLEKPGGFDDLSNADFDVYFREKVNEDLMTIRKNRNAEGKKGWVGRAAILKQSPFAAPRTPAPRWNLNPHVAAKDPNRRQKMLLALAIFRAEYRDALERWRRADKADGIARDDIVFPCGTYQLHVHEKVRCRGPD